ncbi:MAG: inositol monophosphatase [Alphaproteobacteria bacterium]|nr:inositol monophosphatase [Alphaproteobacteria bacterium]
MVQAAIKAGRSLARDFGEVENLQVSRKGPSDFVSAADLNAEKIVRAELQKARPDYGFLMEEAGTIPGEDPQHRWIVDPLDGTTNFLHGIPIFNVSIALERDGVIVAGVIYNPAMDELYTAERGRGAFMNDRRLRVAARKALPDCVVATGIPSSASATMPARSRKSAMSWARLPASAAAARRARSCLDRRGRFDGFWEHGLSPWDMAAGLLMVREAGGFVTDIKGGEKMFETRSIVAGNESIQGQLRKLLANAND